MLMAINGREYDIKSGANLSGLNLTGAKLTGAILPSTWTGHNA